MKFIHLTDFHLIPEGITLDGGVLSDQLEVCQQDISTGHGVRFNCLPGPNPQIPLTRASVAGEFCDAPPAYGVAQIGADQVTVHSNTFQHLNPLHRA